MHAASGRGRRSISWTAVGNCGREERRDPEKLNDAVHPPLAGLVVVEIGLSIAAPYAGMVLDELGAEVIKVSPAISNRVPIVAMNDGTPSPVVISSIASPIKAHAPHLFGRRCEGTKTSVDLRPTAI